MALSQATYDFYHTWLAKADSYLGNEVNDYYNKAFSLFALYNKLYGEATFVLAREDRITLNNNRPFPDSKGAKVYAPQFIGYPELCQELTNDNRCNSSINALIDLIENHTFYIKLSMPYGERQPDKDLILLNNLKSNGAQTKISAILDLIYSVRCNMFHGNKGFTSVQIELLAPVTIVLKKIIEILYFKLQSYQESNP